MRATLATPSLIVLLLGSAGLAAAIDQPLRGDKLSLRRTAAGKEKLVFVSRSIMTTVPAPGSPDDPATGGATIELFSGTEGVATFVVPSGTGQPGWAVDGGRARYRNPTAPAGPTSLRLVSLQSTRRVKIVGRGVGLPLAGPQNRIGVRITTGTLRQCALFEDPSVRVDQAGEFFAGQTLTPGLGFLPDCSDATLTGTLPLCSDGTFGSTGCGGECPAGSA